MWKHVTFVTIIPHRTQANNITTKRENKANSYNQYILLLLSRSNRVRFHLLHISMSYLLVYTRSSSSSDSSLRAHD